MAAIVKFLLLICCTRVLVKVAAGDIASRQARSNEEATTEATPTTACPYLELLRGPVGRDGEKGDTGPQGPKGDVGPPGPSGGGVVYTRWGRTTCPNITGTTLIYTGRVGGSRYSESGGGANYLCLPDDPEYSTTYEPPYYGQVYGTEYAHIVHHDSHNAPCAVCQVSTRSFYLMLPAKYYCPSSWTREYHGYLVTERNNHPSNKVFECLDVNPEDVSGEQRYNGPAHFYYIRAQCNGLDCPPYNSGRPLTCAVCTK